MSQDVQFTASWQVHAGQPGQLLPEVHATCMSFQQFAPQANGKLVAHGLACGTVDILNVVAMVSRRLAPFVAERTVQERLDPAQQITTVKGALLPSEDVTYRQDLKFEPAARAQGQDLVRRLPEYMIPRTTPAPEPA